MRTLPSTSDSSTNSPVPLGFKSLAPVRALTPLSGRTISTFVTTDSLILAASTRSRSSRIALSFPRSRVWPRACGSSAGMRTQWARAAAPEARRRHLLRSRAGVGATWPASSLPWPLPIQARECMRRSQCLPVVHRLKWRAPRSSRPPSSLAPAVEPVATAKYI
eukprot:scaffold64903_cov28-Tisochrysis_lutea.AAC.3